MSQIELLKGKGNDVHADVEGRSYGFWTWLLYGCKQSTSHFDPFTPM